MTPTPHDPVPLIRSARRTLRMAIEAIELEADDARREPPDDEPPTREPPPPPPGDGADHEPPFDGDRGDPPPRREPPAYTGTPVHAWPVTTPRAVDLEWSPEGVKRLRDGKVWIGPDVIDDAWAATRHGRDKPTVIGIRGAVGDLGLGGKYSDHRGFAARVVFVGLTDDAELGPIWHGSEWPVERFELHNCGLRAAPNSFAWRQGAQLGDVAFHNWWFVPMTPGHIHTSGLHFHRGWRSFSASGYQPRGTQFWEHVLYRKGGGPSQIIANVMLGGGRSFDHFRPHGAGVIKGKAFSATPQPRGTQLYEDNVSDGFGWDHATPGGGAVLSCWMSLEFPVVFRGNQIANCRTGGIMCGKGGANTNPYTTQDGYSHSLLWLEDNDIHVNGKGSPDARHAVNLSDSREVAMQGSNRFRSEDRYDLVLDADFSAAQGARPIGQASFLGRDSVPDVEEAATWVPSLDAFRTFSHEELLRMVAPEPQEPGV